MADSLPLINNVTSKLSKALATSSITVSMILFSPVANAATFTGFYRFTNSNVLRFEFEGTDNGDGSVTVDSFNGVPEYTGFQAFESSDMVLGFDVEPFFEEANPVPGFVSFNGLQMSLLGIDDSISDYFILGTLIDPDTGLSIPIAALLDSDSDQEIIELFDASRWTLREGSVPIPTPALLPSLIGMGLAALRRRNSKGSIED